MMLNFPVNAAIRTSSADFLVIAGGDTLFGQDHCRCLASDGTTTGCLYRAAREHPTDFEHAAPSTIEDAANAISIDICREPPFDQPCAISTPAATS